jgi:hypothetical protein
MDTSFYPELRENEAINDRGDIVYRSGTGAGRPKVIATRSDLMVSYWQKSNPDCIGRYDPALDIVFKVTEDFLKADEARMFEDRVLVLRQEERRLKRSMKKREDVMAEREAEVQRLLDEALELKAAAEAELERAKEQSVIEGVEMSNDMSLVELAESGIPVLARRAIFLANRSNQVNQVMTVLKELNDRAFGKPMQGIHHGGQVGVDVTITDVLKSIDGKTSGLPVIDVSDG